ncbi:MAG TPA: glycosyltransferase family 2 protein, partial [Gemmatimonadaceae bacterium]|nr:glycosyltransferase family 2 protein [Gemmatimonadaceae bacterium]
MTPAPTVAVLVTYYNEGELLRECLTSILAQDPPPDEVLVYDDASRIPAQPHVPEGAPVRVIRGSQNVGPGA